ncbi:hypothetical protein M2451_003601 [Dysgonomonas sp. PFB1-18]|uniref:hypothetical protein n=1 Tax=unclassified Dysgonomonas TaxID=2630389 RepID=UPI002476C89B|nr:MULTISPECIES: hypothetical protein [unclassified Dysgonomonas]MDH6310783.1 hypothetical protein [Dysgonomonas sp. PF1-14]MDH6340633.1 hypothetical protein [Dysgonomonas sp. PF1-16]MDH6382260.1 hypothetical protein [Dysgonomonas sp. PFB1-18]MDH6399603.1 hypothetical protein [Dysgonomonas sp. PF1-23]
MKTIKYFLFPYNLKPKGKSLVIRPDINQINRLLDKLKLDNREIDLQPISDYCDITPQTYIIYKGDDHPLLSKGIVSGYVSVLNAKGAYTEEEFYEAVQKKYLD